MSDSETDFFSGDERRPAAREPDGGSDSSGREAGASADEGDMTLDFRSPYTHAEVRSATVGFLPAFFAMLTEQAELWIGVLVVGVLVAMGLRAADTRAFDAIVARPMLFTIGLVVGLGVGGLFVAIGITLPAAA